MTTFYENCLKQKTNNIEKCSSKVMDLVKIDKDKVK